MRKNYEFTTKGGYVFNKKSGKLEEYIPKKILFDFNKESVAYIGLFGCEERIVEEEDFTLYDSISDYESGRPNRDVKSESIGGLLNTIVHGSVEIKDNQILAWTFCDGHVYQEELNDNNILYEVNEYGLVRDTAKLGFEQKLYASREEALMMNDYIVIDKDGNESVRTGVLKAIQLSEEQKTLIEKFKVLYEKLESANIAIGYDNENSCLFAFNKPSRDVSYEYYECKGYTPINDHTQYITSVEMYSGCEGLWIKYED